MRLLKEELLLRNETLKCYTNVVAFIIESKLNNSLNKDTVKTLNKLSAMWDLYEKYNLNDFMKMKQLHSQIPSFENEKLNELWDLYLCKGLEFRTVYTALVGGDINKKLCEIK